MTKEKIEKFNPEDTVFRANIYNQICDLLESHKCSDWSSLAIMNMLIISIVKRHYITKEVFMSSCSTVWEQAVNNPDITLIQKQTENKVQDLQTERK